MKTVAVVTGSVGHPFLLQAVASVRAQTYSHIQHWIVVDGAAHEQAVRDMLGPLRPTERIMVLPENTGGTGYVCHRVYAALPWCVNTDFVAYLDEDNMYESTHIEQLVTAIEGHSWAHSLRSIIDHDSGDILCHDSCESLGGITHSCLGPTDFHVDTNCYLLETHLARQLSPCWNVPARPPPGTLEADRAVCRTLLASRLLPGVSRSHSVRYRVSGRSDSVHADFFIHHNQVTRFDPSKPDIYIFHMTPEGTKAALTTTPPQNPLAEWAPTMWSGLYTFYNVLDGYANMSIIPPGATILGTVWHPSALPLTIFKRTDLRRIMYLLESPNIRHREQFSVEFLRRHADLILTYWMPLLRDLPHHTHFCPMNTHQLNLEDPVHQSLGLRQNKGKGKSVAIVLERRPHVAGSYDINGQCLTCLDPLREAYVKGLRDIVCYGKGWDTLPGVHVGHTLGKMDDPRHSVDILQEYTFALIIENCDATGYVSEKLYDCFMAGTVPLYFGNPVPELGIPPEMYVDIRRFDTGTDLQHWLDSLHAEDIYHMKTQVLKHRESVLRRVGVQSFAHTLHTALLPQAPMDHDAPNTTLPGDTQRQI